MAGTDVLAIDEALAEISGQINEFELVEECTRLSGWYSSWNAKLSIVEREMRVREHEHEMLVARLSYRAREGLLIDKGKATESQIEQAVRMEVQYDVSARALIEAEVTHTRVRGILRALEVKRDMLREIGAHTRQEKGNDPSQRKQYEGHNRTRND